MYKRWEIPWRLSPLVALKHVARLHHGSNKGPALPPPGVGDGEGRASARAVCQRLYLKQLR